VTVSLLVADDHPGYCLLVRTVLDGEPSVRVVGEVRDVEAVRDAAARLRPDAALIDLLLPGGGGFAAAQAIHDLVPGCATIVSSAHTIEELARAGQVGGVAFLPKGLSPFRLADGILDLIAALDRTEPALDEVAATFPPERSSAAAARHFATAALERWACGELVDTTNLLVSELVGNAVLHAGTDVEIDLRLFPDRIRVEVSDRSPTQVRRRDATDEDTSGRGSELIDLLARAWGLTGRPDGKCIWFELDRPDADAGSQAATATT
jgi:DNA-binding NarL/FixJ family response regulator